MFTVKVRLFENISERYSCTIWLAYDLHTYLLEKYMILKRCLNLTFFLISDTEARGRKVILWDPVGDGWCIEKVAS